LAHTQTCSIRASIWGGQGEGIGPGNELLEGACSEEGERVLGSFIDKVARSGD
jgi:hypothetical protein